MHRRTPACCPVPIPCRSSSGISRPWVWKPGEEPASQSSSGAGTCSRPADQLKICPRCPCCKSEADRESGQQEGQEEAKLQSNRGLDHRRFSKSQFSACGECENQECRPCDGEDSDDEQLVSMPRRQRGRRVSIPTPAATGKPEESSVARHYDDDDTADNDAYGTLQTAGCTTTVGEPWHYVGSGGSLPHCTPQSASSAPLAAPRSEGKPTRCAHTHTPSLDDAPLLVGPLPGTCWRWALCHGLRGKPMPHGTLQTAGCTTTVGGPWHQVGSGGSSPLCTPQPASSAPLAASRSEGKPTLRAYTHLRAQLLSFFATFCHDPRQEVLWRRCACTRKSSSRHSSISSTHVSLRVGGPFRGPSLARGSAQSLPLAICRSAASTSSLVIVVGPGWIVRRGHDKASVPCQRRCLCRSWLHHTDASIVQILWNPVLPGVSHPRGTLGRYGLGMALPYIAVSRVAVLQFSEALLPPLSAQLSIVVGFLHPASLISGTMLKTGAFIRSVARWSPPRWLSCLLGPLPGTWRLPRVGATKTAPFTWVWWHTSSAAGPSMRLAAAKTAFSEAPLAHSTPQGECVSRHSPLHRRSGFGASTPFQPLSLQSEAMFCLHRSRKGFFCPSL